MEGLPFPGPNGERRIVAIDFGPRRKFATIVASSKEEIVDTVFSDNEPLMALRYNCLKPISGSP